MTKFKQKEYVAPAIVAALIPAAISGVTSLVNGKRDSELEEQRMMMNSKLQREQLELQKDKAEFLEKLSKTNPSLAAQMFNGQAEFSFKEKAANVIGWGRAASEPVINFASAFHKVAAPVTTVMAIRDNKNNRELQKYNLDLNARLRMEELRNNKERFLEVQKLIRENPEAAALIYQGQGTFSAADTAKEVGKALADTFGEGIFKRGVVPAALTGLGLYGAGKYINYLMKKNNLQYDRRGRLEERNYSVKDYLKGAGNSVKDYFKNTKDSVVNLASDLKNNPKDTLIDAAGGAFTSFAGVNPLGAATRSGMVNRKKIDELAEKLSKSSDADTAKIGEWVAKNPRYSSLMAILAGYGILKGTSKLTRKAVEKGTKALDPEAYDYFDAKNMRIKEDGRQRLFTKYDDTDDLKRMTDADILAARKRISHTGSRSLNAGLGGSVVGAILASLISAGIDIKGKKGFSLDRLAKAAKTGAILGAGLGVGKGILDTQKEREDADWYNRRLDYAKYQARRREARDWRENIGGRERYTY